MYARWSALRSNQREIMCGMILLSFGVAFRVRPVGGAVASLPQQHFDSCMFFLRHSPLNVRRTDYRIRRNEIKVCVMFAITYPNVWIMRWIYFILFFQINYWIRFGCVFGRNVCWCLDCLAFSPSECVECTRPGTNTAAKITASLESRRIIARVRTVGCCMLLAPVHHTLCSTFGWIVFSFRFFLAFSFLKNPRTTVSFMCIGEVNSCVFWIASHSVSVLFFVISFFLCNRKKKKSKLTKNIIK